MTMQEAWERVKALWPDGRYLTIKCEVSRGFGDELRWSLYVTGVGATNKLEYFKTLEDLVAAAEGWARPLPEVCEQLALADVVVADHDNGVLGG